MYRSKGWSIRGSNLAVAWAAPIIKDKLFYFVNYDGQRRSFPIIYTGPSSNNAATA